MNVTPTFENFQSAMTAAVGSTLSGNLVGALQAMGLGAARSAFAAASGDLTQAEMASYQRTFADVFAGIDPSRLGANMTRAHSMPSPSQAMARADLRRSSGGMLGGAVGALTGWALGGPLGAIAGGLAGRSLQRRGKAKFLERRLRRDPGFRAQFEAMTGGKYVPDGRCDGKITIARSNAQVPGLQQGAFSAFSSNMNAGSALSGIVKMMGGAAALMAAVGGAKMMFGSLSYGNLNTGLGMRQRFGMTRTSGGLGSRVARLPANATFEDLVAAFMIDTLKDMQDEAKKLMDKLRRSNQSRKGGGIGGMLGGLGKIGGGLLGGLVGMPGVGASLGSGLGNMLRGGGGAKGEDSRQLMFEELKNVMQKISQMFQSLSNVLNTMHQGAMNSIRNIRA